MFAGATREVASCVYLIGNKYCVNIYETVIRLLDFFFFYIMQCNEG